MTHLTGTVIDADLGETWFVGPEPVFLCYYHRSYKPQFAPAVEDDEPSVKREFVAFSEEWASPDALGQLGLRVIARRDGRVILEPTVTWVCIHYSR